MLSREVGGGAGPPKKTLTVNNTKWVTGASATKATKALPVAMKRPASDFETADGCSGITLHVDDCRFARRSSQVIALLTKRRTIHESTSFRKSM